MSRQLVLSLFPGVGLLDRAFELEGCCVVRGPDALWGGDVRGWSAPRRRFDGVIGGPPCKPFTSLRRINDRLGADPKHPNLIGEFERIVAGACPDWFVMECVAEAPPPIVAGYVAIGKIVRDCEAGGLTVRRRRFTFGVPGPPARGNSALAAFEASLVENIHENIHAEKPLPAVTGDQRLSSVGERIRKNGSAKLLPWPEMLRRQGLPADFLADSPLTAQGKREAVGQGVPLAMGRAVAKAVLRALP